jgi:hypothetical protein
MTQRQNTFSYVLGQPNATHTIDTEAPVVAGFLNTIATWPTFLVRGWEVGAGISVATNGTIVKMATTTWRRSSSTTPPSRLTGYRCLQNKQPKLYLNGTLVAPGSPAQKQRGPLHPGYLGGGLRLLRRTPTTSAS